MTEEKSGFDSLIEALRQSGLDVDAFSEEGEAGPSGAAGSEKAQAGNASADGEAAEGARTSSRRRGRSSGGGRTVKGGKPFSGFPFMDAKGGKGGSGGAGGDGGDGSDEPPYFEIGGGFGAGMASWSKKKIILAIIIGLVILYCAYWWFHPPISINSVDTWVFVAIFILLPIFMFLRSRSQGYAVGTEKLPQSEAKSKRFRILSFVPVAVIAVGILGAILSLSIIPGNAEKYANVLQTQQMNFAQDIPEVDYSQIPVIDHDSAVLLGNREMGTIPDYVSQFEVDDLYSQINYKGKPVRVSPLGYADIFKWFTNRGEGIPAFAIVDMTTQDASIVRLGEGNGMKYTPSEPLARNIDRYVQLKFPFYIFDEKAFEIDEDGHPWWICPVRTYTIGLFGGETVKRVVLCDAVSGECQDLAIEDVPSWVDRAYPSNLLIKQYNWSGAYIHGWFNSWLGQQGVYQTTPGTDGNLGFNYIAKDDDVWVYTGVTSATADSSIIGFVLINQRTAESHFYSVAGATEDSAMQSAEGQVQHLRYQATFPLLINVANQPTYFMALKDAAGLVKMFAMIDIQRYQNVAVGDTVASCQKSYEILLATNGALMSNNSGDTGKTLETADGTVRTIAQAVLDGNTHFYVTLEDDEGIYDFALPAMIEIVAYQPGDPIRFSYVESSPTSPANEFLEKGQKPSAEARAQVEMEAALEEEATALAGSNAAADNGDLADAGAANAGTNAGAANAGAANTGAGTGAADAGAANTGAGADATSGGGEKTEPVIGANAS